MFIEEEEVRDSGSRNDVSERKSHGESSSNDEDNADNDSSSMKEN